MLTSYADRMAWPDEDRDYHRCDCTQCERVESLTTLRALTRAMVNRNRWDGKTNTCVLARVGGYSEAEIARRLGLTPADVHNRIGRVLGGAEMVGVRRVCGIRHTSRAVTANATY